MAIITCVPHSHTSKLQQQRFDNDSIQQAGHAPCQITLLEQIEVRAYAIAPIVQGDRLWGLLAVYQNAEPRLAIQLL